MFNVVLLLVMLGIGVVVVMCLDFRWLRRPLRNDRRGFVRHGDAGITKS